MLYLVGRNKFIQQILISVYKLDYEPFGKPLAMVGNTNRLSFIDKEKDKESILGDFGVRKYDDGLGRFMQVDRMWEKYISLSPYQYSFNNPVNSLDNNGKWVKEISKESHVDKNMVARNKDGYLANAINYKFYDEFKIKAPNVADYIKNNSLFVMQKSLPENVYGQAPIAGITMDFDLSKTDAIKNLAGTVLHEALHSMGYGEFEAYGAMVAAGYMSKEHLIEMMDDLSTGIQVDVFNGKKDLMDKWMKEEIKTEEVVNQMISAGAKVK
ncbi:MAG: hypothetical protein HW421_3910 [Ignavibacteria bacterium]|nr:hypothetical protein [Ignavibacteria bacterium]